MSTTMNKRCCGIILRETDKTTCCFTDFDGYIASVLLTICQTRPRRAITNDPDDLEAEIVAQRSGSEPEVRQEDQHEQPTKGRKGSKEKKTKKNKDKDKDNDKDSNGSSKGSTSRIRKNSGITAQSRTPSPPALEPHSVPEEAVEAVSDAAATASADPRKVGRVPTMVAAVAKRNKNNNISNSSASADNLEAIDASEEISASNPAFSSAAAARPGRVRGLGSKKRSGSYVPKRSGTLDKSFRSGAGAKDDEWGAGWGDDAKLRHVASSDGYPNNSRRSTGGMTTQGSGGFASKGTILGQRSKSSDDGDSDVILRTSSSVTEEEEEVVQVRVHHKGLKDQLSSGGVEITSTSHTTTSSQKKVVTSSSSSSSSSGSSEVISKSTSAEYFSRMENHSSSSSSSNNGNGHGRVGHASPFHSPQPSSAVVVEIDEDFGDEENDDEGNADISPADMVRAQQQSASASAAASEAVNATSRGQSKPSSTRSSPSGDPRVPSVRSSPSGVHGLPPITVSIPPNGSLTTEPSPASGFSSCIADGSGGTASGPSPLSVGSGRSVGRKIARRSLTPSDAAALAPPAPLTNSANSTPSAPSQGRTAVVSPSNSSIGRATTPLGSIGASKVVVMEDEEDLEDEEDFEEEVAVVVERTGLLGNPGNGKSPAVTRVGATYKDTVTANDIHGYETYVATPDTANNRFSSGGMKATPPVSAAALVSARSADSDDENSPMRPQKVDLSPQNAAAAVVNAPAGSGLGIAQGGSKVTAGSSVVVVEDEEFDEDEEEWDGGAAVAAVPSPNTQMNQHAAKHMDVIGEMQKIQAWEQQQQRQMEEEEEHYRLEQEKLHQQQQIEDEAEAEEHHQELHRRACCSSGNASLLPALDTINEDDEDSVSRSAAQSTNCTASSVSAPLGGKSPFFSKEGADAVSKLHHMDTPTRYPEGVASLTASGSSLLQSVDGAQGNDVLPGEDSRDASASAAAAVLVSPNYGVRQPTGFGQSVTADIDPELVAKTKLHVDPSGDTLTEGGAAGSSVSISPSYGVRQPTGFGRMVNADIDPELVARTKLNVDSSGAVKDEDHESMDAATVGSAKSGGNISSSYGLRHPTGFGSYVNRDINPDLVSSTGGGDGEREMIAPSKSGESAASPTGSEKPLEDVDAFAATLLKPVVKQSLFGSSRVKKELKEEDDIEARRRLMSGGGKHSGDTNDPTTGSIFPAHCFEERAELNITDEGAANLLALSCSQPDILLGWQIELFRTSDPNFSLGVHIIVDTKKKQYKPTKYLLKTMDCDDLNGAEVDRWAILKRAADKAGKPFRLMRKVLNPDGTLVKEDEEY